MLRNTCTLNYNYHWSFVYSNTIENVTHIWGGVMVVDNNLSSCQGVHWEIWGIAL